MFGKHKDSINELQNEIKQLMEKNFRNDSAID